MGPEYVAESLKKLDYGLTGSTEYTRLQAAYLVLKPPLHRKGCTELALFVIFAVVYFLKSASAICWYDV
jgi:hypothetical protein